MSSLAELSPAQFRHARVALFSTWHPEPVDNGRKQRTRMIIDALSPIAEIVLITLVDETLEQRASLPLVSGVCAQYALPLPAFRPRSISGLKGALSGQPRSIVATWSKSTADKISRIVARHESDIAIGTDMRSIQYLTALPSTVARLLDEPDVSPFVAGREHPGTLNGLRARIRERKYRRFLHEEVRELDAVIVASALEAAAFQRLSGSCAEVIDNCVAGLPETAWQPSGSTRLLFTGSLTYRPNLEAIEYVVDNVLATVERVYPDISLVVTGALPDLLPAVAGHPRLELTGHLAALDALYRQAGIFILPLLSGTGTRVKLLEALAFGIPVVSTSKGAEGLPVEHGRHLLLADDPDEFAGAILRLMADTELCVHLGGQARALVARHFTRDVIGALWRQHIATLLAGRSNGTSHGE